MIHSFSSLLGNLDIRLHISLSRMVTEKQMFFLDWKAEMEKNTHLSYGIYILYCCRTVPLAVFLVLQDLFCTGDGLQFWFQWNTTQNKAYREWDKHSLCLLGFFLTSASFYLGFYITLAKGVFHYISLIAGWDKGK